jgi:hypothetical protein
VAIEQAVEDDRPMARGAELPNAVASDITRAPDNKYVHGKEAFIAFQALLASDFLLITE